MKDFINGNKAWITITILALAIGGLCYYFMVYKKPAADVANAPAKDKPVVQTDPDGTVQSGGPSNNNTTT